MNPPLQTAPCGPGVTRHFFDAGLESWCASVEGATDYWTGALARSATPIELGNDLLRWLELTTRRRPPRWHSANRVAQRSDIALLRDFSNRSRAAVKPTLVLPPQAGHHSCVVDYSGEQSQIQVIRSAGLERVFVLEWLEATQKTKDAGIDDYIAVIDRALERIGEPVNLIGDCQGGWLATIYAALRPERVNTLTIAGAPIDFHAGEAVIGDYVDLIEGAGDLDFYRALVALGGGVLKGELMLGGFLAIKPENEIAKQMQLLAHLDDAKHVERYQALEDWFKHTHDIAGAFYLWIVERLFRDNALIGGELEVGGERVDLGRITCPLNLLAGAADHITPPAQVFALERAASTPGSAVTKRTTSGGHLGLFMGRTALRDHWPLLMADVLEHSRARAKRDSSVRRARVRTPARRRPIPLP